MSSDTATANRGTASTAAASNHFWRSVIGYPVSTVCPAGELGVGKPYEKPNGDPRGDQPTCEETQGLIEVLCGLRDPDPDEEPDCDGGKDGPPPIDEVAGYEPDQHGNADVEERHPPYIGSFCLKRSHARRRAGPPSLLGLRWIR